ncbi:hypothetical protein [Flavobacterium selenitireducens]|uniref:hypothetical protein n=1 Tax=Flavobacterium selenitireducens TaxID=2722704 RepID=UPI00168ABC36|nr:hypothetical protein [Flavobacterium selenitireducens]MBD3583019.1 hypothetical protein [Flavobacterium selenitireducens]
MDYFTLILGGGGGGGGSCPGFGGGGGAGTVTSTLPSGDFTSTSRGFGASASCTGGASGGTTVIVSFNGSPGAAGSFRSLHDASARNTQANKIDLTFMPKLI